MVAEFDTERDWGGPPPADQVAHLFDEVRRTICLRRARLPTGRVLPMHPERLVCWNHRRVRGSGPTGSPRRHTDRPIGMLGRADGSLVATGVARWACARPSRLALDGSTAQLNNLDLKELRSPLQCFSCDAVRSESSSCGTEHCGFTLLGPGGWKGKVVIGSLRRAGPWERLRVAWIHENAFVAST
jgi:hypothetical protein